MSGSGLRAPAASVPARAAVARPHARAVLGACAALLLLSSACAREEPVVACTEIGCNDGLTVQLAGTVPAEYTVRVVPEEGEAREQACGPDRVCEGSVFFSDFTPERVTVQVLQAGELLAEDSMRPDYETVRPNGPDCPPVCRQGTVTLTLE